MSFDAKEQVKRATDIVDLVGGYLQLRREGRGYKALCPWHNDTNPSLQVNPERQSFKCWVCDIGGDVFSFMMQMEKVAFPEALAMLAERAGIQLHSGSANRQSRDEKQLLYEAMAWAEEQFHRFLLESPEAERARRYLAERGVVSDSLARYRLGYSPEGWTWLLDRARGSKVSPQALEKVGLVKRSERGSVYDRFRGRVIFSIRDSQGRPIACGGRVLPGSSEENAAKYINSPESPLFSKSSLVYGLDQAKDAIGKSQTALVMEGYTDCLIAQQCGFGNAVAVMGTALGERHLHLLRRFYADRIVLVLDGDMAGRKRTAELLELFVAEQVDLRVLTLPDELDPCDFLLTRGAEAFEELVGQAVDAVEHCYQLAVESVSSKDDTHAVNQAVEKVLATLAKAPRLRSGTPTAARLKEAQVLNRLAHRCGVTEEQLRARLASLRRPARQHGRGASEEISANRAPPDPWGQELLEIVVQSPGLIATVRQVVGVAAVESPMYRRILARCYELAATGVAADFDRLLLEFDEPELKNCLVDLDEQARAHGKEDIETRLEQLLAGYQRRNEERDRRMVAGALAEHRVDETEELNILQRIIDSERSRQGISQPTDG